MVAKKNNPGFPNGWGHQITPDQKSNIDTQNDTMFERRYMFQGPSFLVSIRSISGVYIFGVDQKNALI